jgi:uncharacterized protein YbcI
LREPAAAWLPLADALYRGSVAVTRESGHPPSGPDGELLAQVSNAVVQTMEEFFGQGPTRAKSYMLDDLLLVVTRGGLTRAERTMLDFGHPDMVRGFRQLFENEMTDRLISTMEDLTGRKILTYQS